MLCTLKKEVSDGGTYCGCISIVCGTGLVVVCSADRCVAWIAEFTVHG